ncbi:MAG: FAD-dependent oxidoreductase [Planctomycetota bacterium]|nr:MAG: FAD-dependent oxidoreductase [Planctomycetota bacterium]
MSAKAEAKDLVIVGAGPAGCAAAITALRRGGTAVLIESKKQRPPRPCSGWLGPAAVALAEELGVSEQAAGARRFQGVQLHSWDLRQSAALTDKALQGWVVDRAQFDAALLDAAVETGATLRAGAARDVDLGEDQVRVTYGSGKAADGRLLLIADGAQSVIAGAAKLVAAGRLPEARPMLLAESACSHESVELHVAVGASRAGQLATIVRLPDRVRVAVATGESEPSPAQQFHTFVAAARDRGLLPADLDLRPIELRTPAGLALDIDTHVGKRCLLIGDAGGFVSAFSNEGLYPAMRSGCIAAETALDALKATHPQDALAEFGVRWRTELADYLRMPNTDLALLMPLVFNNPQMSLRVGLAFLLGQQF